MISLDRRDRLVHVKCGWTKIKLSMRLDMIVSMPFHRPFLFQ